MNTIVTHISPDLDALSSTWLILRYLPDWESADFAFVPAGETLNGSDPDTDPTVIHVDTGLGRFDHHQMTTRTSATKRVFEFLIKNNHIKSKDTDAVKQLVDFVTEIDNFGEVRFPDPTNNRYSFCLHEFVYPLRGSLSSAKELVSMVVLILDAILFTIKNNLHAQKDIKEGFVMKTKWGKTIVMETKNESAVKYALKSGYELVLRRDPATHHVRIKTQPNDRYDLTSLYDELVKLDPKATWFLHISKNMLLNGSSKNPDSVATTLDLKRLIAILKKI